jgi:hypothetical protein
MRRLLQGWQTNVNGSELWSMLNASFAWIPTQGYTTQAGLLAKFPVVVGEFGSSLVDASEQAFLRDFALFANNLGTAAQPPHANITSWTWCV